jgi:CRISPR-associated protein Cas8b/Csh1 subtype I-B
MFPVHPEAVKVLEGTMNLLERELFFNFYNMRFFVLPHFVAITDRNVRQELAENFYQKCKVNAKEAKENARTFANLNQSIFNSETLFHVLVEDQDLGRNDLYYDIFFYEQKQAQFAIKLHVSDVLPSRFRALLDAKEYIENKYSPITRKTTKEGKPYIYYMRFTNIKDYFSSKVKTDIIFEPIFFKIVEALFYKSQLNENQIIKAFLNKIVLAFKSDGTGFEFQDQVKHSFCIHQFFQILQLFGDMPQNVEKNALVALTVTEFVAQHPFFFAQKSPLKKAAFYLGCAAEVLLTAQRVRLGSEPFLKDLNNLQLGYKELQTIYPRLLAKAKQYQEAGNLHDKYFNALLTDFLENIVLVDPAENDKIATSFAFSLGLVMEKSFLSERIRLAKERKEARENE